MKTTKVFETKKVGKDVLVINFTSSIDVYSLPEEHELVKGLDVERDWFSCLIIENTIVVFADISGKVHRVRSLDNESLKSLPFKKIDGQEIHVKGKTDIQNFSKIYNL